MSRIASAPGRVNLLGEHVDHQGGTVLPVAIHLRTTVTFTPGERWEIASEGHAPDGAWRGYVHAVIETLEAAGYDVFPGRIEIASALPEERGLASSAALEVAVAGALCNAAPFDLAHLCRTAEAESVGVPCGLMDPMTAACAIAGHVLVLDCAEATFFHLPLPDVELLLFECGATRRLAGTPYAERQAEARRPGTPAARHVAAEKARVERGLALLEEGELERFGRLLFESHDSLRDLYRCSLPPIDERVETLRGTRGVYGARLIGAGWGGAVLALAEPGLALSGARRLRSDDGLTRLA